MRLSLIKNPHFIGHFICSCAHLWPVCFEISTNNGSGVQKKHLEGTLLVMPSQSAFATLFKYLKKQSLIRSFDFMLDFLV